MGWSGFPGTQRTAHIRLPRWWRRRSLLAAVLPVLLALSYADHRGYLGWRGDDRARYQGKWFRCIDVVDGDTIDIDVPDGRTQHTRVRLRGVDSPEVARPDHPGMYFGPEATNYTAQSLLEQSVRIELAPGRTRDRYGRLLGYVYLEETGEPFNSLLVRDGFAYADDRFDDPMQAEFAGLEEEARNHKRGLWVGVSSDLLPAWKRRSPN